MTAYTLSQLFRKGSESSKNWSTCRKSQSRKCYYISGYHETHDWQVSQLYLLAAHQHLYTIFNENTQIQIFQQKFLYKGTDKAKVRGMSFSRRNILCKLDPLNLKPIPLKICLGMEVGSLHVFRCICSMKKYNQH